MKTYKALADWYNDEIVLYTDDIEEARDAIMERIAEIVRTERSKWKGEKPTLAEARRWNDIVWDREPCVTKWDETEERYVPDWWIEDDALADVGMVYIDTDNPNEISTNEEGIA